MSVVEERKTDKTTEHEGVEHESVPRPTPHGLTIPRKPEVGPPRTASAPDREMGSGPHCFCPRSGMRIAAPKSTDRGLHMQHVRRRTHIRPLTFAVAMLASLLLALPALAHAATHQLTGTAFFNPSQGTPCPDSSAYDSYPPIVMTGSLDGCWYTHIETARITRGGVYLESGTELFVGRLDAGPAGTFTTTYKFEAKLNADGAEVRGRCQHPIVSGSGTGGFAGATGRVDFKDIIGDPITYEYRGHISLR
jgi:hypothetical protein